MKVAGQLDATRLEDGRLEVLFRQSGLSTLEECLERGRLLATEPRVENDAACVGTAIHEALDSAINHLIAEGEPIDVEPLLVIGEREFRSLSETPGFIWAKYDMKMALRFVHGAISLWWEEVYPILRPIHTELQFGPFPFYEDEKCVLKLKGTIDYVDARMGLIDWKTSGGRQWQAWEKQRWSIQATAYLRAAYELGLIEADAPWPFTFMVFEEGKEVKLRRITTTRNFGDFNWLIQKCLGIVALIESGATPWPMTDDHALCSEKWCPVFAKCKGKHVEPGWDKRYDQGWPLELDPNGEPRFVLLRPSKLNPKPVASVA